MHAADRAIRHDADACAPASPPAPTVSRDVSVVGDVIARHASKALRVEIDDPAVGPDLYTPAQYLRVLAAEAAS